MDFEKGKCYKMEESNGIYICKLKSIRHHSLDTKYVDVEAEKGIFINTNRAAIVQVQRTYVKLTKAVEIDESLLDRVIKMFTMNKTAILALINKDE